MSKQRQEPEIREKIVMKERKLTSGEKLGGAAETLIDALSFG